MVISPNMTLSSWYMPLHANVSFILLRFTGLPVLPSNSILRSTPLSLMFCSMVYIFPTRRASYLSPRALWRVLNWSSIFLMMAGGLLSSAP
ncbi:MAG: hypothetical protein BWX71_02415 [Deltaproteobacteria bacterium ADurb.Bin072]|nr:MAG: hypothetical protein BWX71_02415 [Deltaproteobacteria bacterium ADurb.Bin072]